MKRKTDNFDKFFNRKRNSAIKEQFKQEKKAAKKERKEAIERHFEAKRQAKAQQFQAGKPGPAVGKPADAHLRKLPGKKKPPTLPLKDVGHEQAPTNKQGSPAGAHTTHAPAFGGGDQNQIPLNKYIAHSGICSRRDAAELIRQGKVQVNDQLITEPGTKVSPDDFVKVNGKKVTISRNFVYILLNKPKDYITTAEDPQGRKTVLDLTRHATTERVYPVGRLDRNTSGVLLLTNDGDLAQKLAHPKHEIKKIYHVSLDKPLTKADFDKIIGGGVILEDGVANVDVLAYEDPRDKTQIGLEIHSGRNRIVRRIFEHLGYDVRGLDRVMYAGLTKKNVQRGKWRLLTEKEIRILKYLNSSTRSAAQNKAIQADKAAYRKKVTSRNIDVDDFLENDADLPEGATQKDLGGKKDFGGKKSFPGKKNFAGKKDFAAKKDFGGKKESGARKDFAAKKDFGAKKGPGKSFAPRKEGPGKKSTGPRIGKSRPATARNSGSHPSNRPAK